MDHTSIAKASSQSSCRLVAPWMKICYADFITIVCVVVFACYVIWGANYTILLFQWLRRKISGPRNVDPEANPEGINQGHTNPRTLFRRGNEINDSPTARLQRFMHRDGNTHSFVPPTNLLPDLPDSSTSATSDSSDGCGSPRVQNDPVLQERFRMSRFRFPPSPRSHTPPPVDIEDFFSPLASSPRNSGCSNDTVGDHLNDLLFNPYWTQSQTKLAQGQSFGMLNFEDAMSAQAQEQIPNTPPPAYDETEASSSPADEKDAPRSSRA